MTLGSVIWVAILTLIASGIVYKAKVSNLWIIPVVIVLWVAAAVAWWIFKMLLPFFIITAIVLGVVWVFTSIANKKAGPDQS